MCGVTSGFLSSEEEVGRMGSSEEHLGSVRGKLVVAVHGLLVHLVPDTKGPKTTCTNYYF